MGEIGEAKKCIQIFGDGAFGKLCLEDRGGDCMGRSQMDLRQIMR